MFRRSNRWAAAGLVGGLLIGCSGSTPAPVPNSSNTSTTSNSEIGESESAFRAVETATPAAPKRRPVQLGSAGSASSAVAAEQQAESILTAMQPLQVLLGKWNGMPRNKPQPDEPEWVWDFQTNRAQPSLVMRSDKSLYIREGRLTFLPDQQRYQFTWKTPEGDERVLRGEFVEPVSDVPGDDKKLQRTFKLQLTSEPRDSGEQWQLAIHQLENNRYLLEVDRRKGSGAFQRIDTVHTQREGTSFALSSTDYGEKTCIISQGLGTITVSYKGQSYYVCCTGCKAAFEEDPERWIAKWEERKKALAK